MEKYQEKNSISFNILFLILIFCLWYIMAYLIHSDIILPYPHSVISDGISLFISSNLLRHLLVTVYRAILGLSLSFISGLILGALETERLHLVIRGVVDFFQSNPIIVWITLALLWLGFGTWTVLFSIFIMLFPNFYLSVYSAVLNIPRGYKELFVSYPISRVDYVFKFYIPYLKPFITPVFINSLTSSLKITAMAEFFATNNGIGFLLGQAKTFLNTREIYFYAILLYLIVKLSEGLLRALFKWRTQ